MSLTVNPKRFTYIYILKNPFSGAIFYVGKTIQDDRRLRDHVVDAKLDRYSTPEMRKHIRDILAQGKRPIYQVIYIVKPDQDWWDIERFFVIEYRKKYKTFNISDGGYGCEQSFITEEGLEKLRRKFSKPVLCYHADTGEFITEFSSAKEASVKLGLHRERITAVCNGRNNTTGGFIFRHKTEDCKVKISPAKTRGKDVLQLDKKGKLIKRWTSGHLAAKELNLDHSAILKVCKGQHKNQKSHGGFIWKFADNQSPRYGK